MLSWVLAREWQLTSGAAAATVFVHTLHVSLSRLYLGVHSLADVVGGLGIGAACVAAYPNPKPNPDPNPNPKPDPKPEP